MIRSFFEWVFRRRFTATLIARGSIAFDALRGEIKRDINVLVIQMQSSDHAQSILKKAAWSYITKDRNYEWHFYLINGDIVASCRHRYGKLIFSNRDKDLLIPLADVVNVHRTVTELNSAMMKSFGGMQMHLGFFAEAGRYYKG